ncbi:uncharacterized protein RSE6_01739 [Rhynchosporium secalis]|uniref:Uncharacterized protein n=1 Tax=Rhynchosporium secalis TaxID=38038 RepID=A0A1E1LYG7_RHYSE|nr:uncharacterized protein RSE6_01739 [Rhynchosporium secalis]
MMYRAAGRVYPELFDPPNPASTPQDLFDNERRYIRKPNTREILIYTDKACSRNGQCYLRGGCSFLYQPSVFNEEGALTHGVTTRSMLLPALPTGLFVRRPRSGRDTIELVAAPNRGNTYTTFQGRRYIVLTYSSSI